MLGFIETPRFNTEIRYGTEGSPEFSTEIVTVSSGTEVRNANWQEARGIWTLSSDEIYNLAEKNFLLAFFRERMGKAGGFRYKDWSDYTVTTANGSLGSIVGSSTTMQLRKKYVTENTIYRNITKPVPDTVVIYDREGVVVSEDDWTLDTTTGVVTIIPGWYTWSGEFDVPARFDSDKLDIQNLAYREQDGEALFSVSNLSIVEITTVRDL